MSTHEDSDPETNKKYLCKCFICKANNQELGGQFVTYITYWRHKKKAKQWSDIDTDSSNDDLNESQANSIQYEEK
jgi:hypothetical protein